MTGEREFSGTITAGRFRLVRALGDGVAGRVHEARHDRLADRFAVKLFGDVEPCAFQRGAQQASSLHHAGLVKVVDYGVALGHSCIVMEWIEGRSLAAMLASGGALAPDAVARIVDSIALGLQAAHRRGLAHGHLAPNRVLMLAPGTGGSGTNPGAGQTKILGFGLGPDLAHRSSAGTAPTPYTAPEQPASDASPLGDQYALAAIAYELLTGVPPEVTGGRRAARSIREYDPTINVILDEVVQRALSRDPASRWADVYSFSKHLREAAAADGELEERTRLAPLPLTVSRPGRTPTPIDLPPVVASIDVDLRTPLPTRLELPLQGEVSMNPPSNRPSASRAPQSFHGGSQFPPPSLSPRATSHGPSAAHYPIRPTPTFSFTDDPEPGPLYKPRGGRRRGRSGGGLGLAFLIFVAAAGGYLTVQTHAWQDVEPLMGRAKELVISLRALASGDMRAPATPAGTTPGPARAHASAGVNQVSAGGEAAPAIHPEVVPIEPAARSTKAPPGASAQRSSQDAHASQPARAPEADSRGHHRRKHGPTTASGHSSKALSDEAAAEEALLADPSGGR
ncbi:MAG TPA: protein kinase [Polyangia bacterium]|jgi:serine/threonine-protein kinase|nr:protein kinase [Polyangia bacterium]